MKTATAKARRPDTAEMETTLASYFDWRVNMIVPNVFWGLGVHECDLLVVTKSGYATEVEIKISRADLKKDSAKNHGHKSKKIKRLFFAIPEHLAHCHEFIPAHAGILHVCPEREYGWCVKWIREPIENPDRRKLTDDEMQHLGCLASMRIWGLKHTIISLANTNKDLRAVAEDKEKGITHNIPQQTAKQCTFISTDRWEAHLSVPPAEAGKEGQNVR